MAVILDGKATSAQVRGEIATAARALTERTGVVPGLAVVAGLCPEQAPCLRAGRLLFGGL